jgi:predicted NACHT family NTPase
MMNLAEHSRYWPWIKAIAKLINVPGTHIGLEPLIELQNGLAEDQFREQVKAMLEVMYHRTAEIVQLLNEQKEAAINVDVLRAVAEDLAEDIYLKHLAAKYYFADFKGVEQQSNFVSLPLDDIFIDLKAMPEDRQSSLREKEHSLRARLEFANEMERGQILHNLEELDANGPDSKSGSEACSIDHLLANAGPAVLLGGPGSGKTTLVKRLARSCALGAAIFQQRYPKMPWCFPVVLPITQFASEAAGRTLLDFMESLLRERGGDALAARYRHHWNAGRVLLLLDGLDEIAAVAQRISSARAVDVALKTLNGPKSSPKGIFQKKSGIPPWGQRGNFIDPVKILA